MEYVLMESADQHTAKYLHRSRQPRLKDAYGCRVGICRKRDFAAQQDFAAQEEGNGLRLGLFPKDPLFSQKTSLGLTPFW
jgi:hypothetical protein